MALKEYHCLNCGKAIDKNEVGAYFCKHCGHTFYDTDAEEQLKAIQATLGDTVTDALVAAEDKKLAQSRSKLWEETHAEYVSYIEIRKCCDEIEKSTAYNETDRIKARFYKLATDDPRNNTALNNYIQDEIAAKNYAYADEIAEFAIRTMQKNNEQAVKQLLEVIPSKERKKELSKEYKNKCVEIENGDTDVYKARDVFVSYDSNDSEQAEKTVKLLESKNITCFYSKRNLPNSQDNFWKNLYAAIDSCKVFLFLSSAKSRDHGSGAYTEIVYVNTEYVNKGRDKPRLEYLLQDYSAKYTDDENTVRSCFTDCGTSWVEFDSKEELCKTLRGMLDAAKLQRTGYDGGRSDRGVKYCIACGTENPSAAKLCMDCGNREFVSTHAEFAALKDREKKQEIERVKAETERLKREELEKLQSENAQKLAEIERIKQEEIERLKRESERDRQEEIDRLRREYQDKLADVAATTDVDNAVDADVLQDIDAVKREYETKLADAEEARRRAEHAQYMASNKLAAAKRRSIARALFSVFVLIAVSVAIFTIVATVNTRLFVAITVDHYWLWIFFFVLCIVFCLVCCGIGFSKASDHSDLHGRDYVLLICGITAGVATLLFSVMGGLIRWYDAKIAFIITYTVALFIIGAVSSVGGIIIYPKQVVCYVTAAVSALCAAAVGTNLEYISNIEMHVDIPSYASHGLSYWLNNNDEYSVFGLGECTDQDILIPSEHYGKRVSGISAYAFKDCENITSITIPNTVTNISGEAFNGCSGLTEITVQDGNVKYHSKGDCLIDTAKKEVVAGCRSSEIPADGSVKSIGNHAFSGHSGLAGITIPEGVTAIGDYAFFGCDGLLGISIPNSVTTVGASAFAHCDGLSGITLPNSVTTIGAAAFYGCNNIKSITIPDGVTSIGKEAFSYCSALESITVKSGNVKYHSNGNCLIETAEKLIVSGCKNSVIPSDGSVTRISNNAFSGCVGLTELTIPDTIISIGTGAFAYCSGLEKITVQEGNKYYRSAGNCIISKRLMRSGLELGCKNSVIPEDGSVTYIGMRAFYGCTGLTEISIPDSITSITHEAFSGCIGLTKLTIPSSVTFIGMRTFDGCVNLTELTIPSSVTYIGYSAFDGCDKLLQEENGVSYVDKWAVDCDTEVADISICADTVGIAESAFSGNRKLTSIELPYGVKYICDGAFKDCSYLTDITIPDTVVVIDGYVFSDCNKLSSITFNGTKAQFEAATSGNAWNDRIDGYTVYCTDGKILCD